MFRNPKQIETGNVLEMVFFRIYTISLFFLVCNKSFGCELFYFFNNKNGWIFMSKTKERVLSLFTIPLTDDEFQNMVSAIMRTQKPLITEWQENEVA